MHLGEGPKSLLTIYDKVVARSFSLSVSKCVGQQKLYLRIPLINHKFPYIKIDIVDVLLSTNTVLFPRLSGFLDYIVPKIHGFIRISSVLPSDLPQPSHAFLHPKDHHKTSRCHRGCHCLQGMVAGIQRKWYSTFIDDVPID